MTCHADVSPARLARAVRSGVAVDGDPALVVQSRSPGPVHQHVGSIHPDMGLKVRTALARAGRTRDMRTPFDNRIAELRRRLEAIEVPERDARAERRTVARTGSEADRLAERVAEHRGRLEAHREAGEDVESVAGDLEAAVAGLADVETAAVAARQEHDRKRAAVRSARNRLDDRLALEDDLANARRAARACLVERLTDAYEAALRALPGQNCAPEPFDVAPVPASLAVARVARPDAPVVVAADRFEDAGAAAAWLDAPVIRLGV
ncbi:MAG: hypothetical protein V5A18_03850 [Haloarculaceae archaeon]